MFDSSALARSVAREIQVLADRLTRNAPNTLHDELGKHQYPSEAALTHVLEQAFWASLLTEEGRHCRFRLSYAAWPFERGEQIAYRLRDPLPLDGQHLRRLSYAHDYRRGDLLWREQGDAVLILGISAPALSGERLGLTIRATAPGVLDVSWNSYRLLYFNRGTVVTASEARLQALVGAHVLVQQAFPQFSADTITASLRVIFEQGHGGSIWILNTGIPIPPTLRIAYPLADGFPLLDRYTEPDELRPWLQCLARFAGVDGAVLIDTSLRVLGFGVFTDIGSNTRALRLLSSGEATIVEGDAIGGGRHRAAVAFCAQNAPAAAYVVSQDGRVSVFSRSLNSVGPFLIEVLPIGHGEDSLS